MMDTEQQLKQLLNSGDLDDAQRIIHSLDSSFVENVNILSLCAMVYRRLNNLNKAVEFSSRAVCIEPNNLSLAIDCSTDLLKLGKLDMAQTVLDDISKFWGNNASLLLHQSEIHYQNKDYKSATKILVNVIQQHPKFAAAHMELAHALLMDGKWHAGWLEYEWRYHLPKTQNIFPKFKMPHWDGSKNVPHILLIADQGFGDCFQFSRYIPLVAQRCERVTLIRSEPLARLFDSIPSISSSYIKWEDTPLTSAYCTLSGLPKLFSTRTDTIPMCEGILSASTKDLLRWKKRIHKSGNEPKLRIGIAWSGRIEFKNNYLRAVPFAELETLLDIPMVEFFSLQVGAPASDAKNKNITDLSTELTDFAETAAAMEALDLVITSDTSIAHLAGMLNRPTWVLLNYSPDWRWGPTGSISSWYPSMRLFRQNQTRNWKTVIDECKTALQNIMTTSSPLSALASKHR